MKMQASSVTGANLYGTHLMYRVGHGEVKICYPSHQHLTHLMTLLPSDSFGHGFQSGLFYIVLRTSRSSVHPDVNSLLSILACHHCSFRCTDRCMHKNPWVVIALAMDVDIFMDEFTKMMSGLS